MKMNSFRAFFTLLISICLLAACQPGSSESPAGSRETQLDPNNPDIIWAKRTNFKLDFNDESGQIENVKLLDRSLAKIVLQAVEKGELKAYDYYENRPLAQFEVENIYHKVDSIYTLDPDTDEEEMVIVRNDLDVDNVTRFRVQQEWFYEKGDQSLQSKLISIAPLLAKYGDDGNYRGDLPLFRVYFE